MMNGRSRVIRNDESGIDAIRKRIRYFNSNDDRWQSDVVEIMESKWCDTWLVRITCYVNNENVNMH